MKRIAGPAATLFTAFMLLGTATPVQAVPVLQLYVEGAVYDDEHESWVFDAAPGVPVRLWVIGNTQGPGGKGTIFGVKLSIVYPDPVPGDGGANVTFTLTPSTTGGFGGFTDPSTPAAPTFLRAVEDGSAPTLYDGTSLAPHGVYIEGNEWQEFLLGDFTLADSPVADFIDSFPGPDFPASGQINVYELTVEGDVPDLHFDAYDHVVAGVHAKAVFAPFSHDAGTGINDGRVPEPVTLALIGTGLLLLGLRRRVST